MDSNDIPDALSDTGAHALSHTSSHALSDC